MDLRGRPEDWAGARLWVWGAAGVRLVWGRGKGFSGMALAKAVLLSLFFLCLLPFLLLSLLLIIKINFCECIIVGEKCTKRPSEADTLL